MRLRRITAIGGTVVLLCPAAARASGATDYGGFRDVLAAGQGQDVNALQLAQYELTNQPPASFVDQLPLYSGLLYAEPTLGPADLDKYFKDESFGIPSGQMVSNESPEPGLVIERDQYNVPHIYGQTRSETMFGVGYAQAEDRLFFMDLLRHLGRGELSQFVGPGTGNSFLRMDADQLRLSDYNEAELGRLIDNGVRAAGSDGPLLRQDLNDFTAGINAYIALTQRDPTKLPAEYPGIGQLPQPWRQTDTAAVASLIAGLEGYGGGRSVDAAAVLSAARARFGARAGRAVFDDFRQQNDPETPVTTTRHFSFDNPGPVNRRSVAIPDPGSVRPTTVTVSGGVGADRRLGLPELPPAPLHSHGLLIDGSRSRSGHPLAVMGPQLGFFSPEALDEIDVHGPGLNVRGVMLPGVFLVIMGRGPDFVWSATTATTDDTDEFIEKLCNPDGSRPSLTSTHYLYHRRCVSLIERKRVEMTPGPNGLSPTQTPETLTFSLERSVHGPIQGRATVHGAPVAIALARSSYFHDLDGAEGFKLLESGQVHSASSFQRAMAKVDLGFNWMYADDRDVTFVQSGWYPHRARGSDFSLPIWGTGRWDWRGFNPRTYTESHIGFAGLPKDTNPRRGYLINWNNDAARGWSAADNEWGYGPIYRSLMFERPVRAALAGNGKLDLAGLVKIMESVVTTDLRGKLLYPLLRKVIGHRVPAGIAPAVGALDKWVADGSYRRDLNHDNVYEDSAGIALMDAWWPILMRDIYEPVLGPALLDRILAMVPFDRSPSVDYTDYGVGWYGYLDKDLRAVMGQRVPDLSRRYCGHGSLRRCRAIIVASLTAAYAQVRAQQGTDMSRWKVNATCAGQGYPQACDQIEFTTGGAVSTPPIPWQNRPTFQQIAEIQGHRPR